MKRSVTCRLVSADDLEATVTWPAPPPAEILRPLYFTLAMKTQDDWDTRPLTGVRVYKLMGVVDQRGKKAPLYVYKEAL